MISLLLQYEYDKPWRAVRYSYFQVWPVSPRFRSLQVNRAAIAASAPLGSENSTDPLLVLVVASHFGTCAIFDNHDPGGSDDSSDNGTAAAGYYWDEQYKAWQLPICHLLIPQDINELQQLQYHSTHLSRTITRTYYYCTMSSNITTAQAEMAVLSKANFTGTSYLLHLHQSIRHELG